MPVISYEVLGLCIICYLRQGGYVLAGICLFVCLLAGQLKTLLTKFDEMFWRGVVRVTSKK